MITGIIVALLEELSSLTTHKLKLGEYTFINAHTVIIYAGTGVDNATLASKQLITLGATQLISWGCAASLIPSLHSGTLILPAQLISHDNNIYPINSAWLQHAKSNLTKIQPYIGNIAESLTIVATPTAKHQLHQDTQAVAVDMESVAIAKIAAQNQLPYLVIRTIADPVTMQLPSVINQALNAQGQVQLSKLLQLLCFHPQQLPALIKLGWYFHKAQNKLKSVAKHLDTITSFQ